MDGVKTPFHRAPILKRQTLGPLENVFYVSTVLLEAVKSLQQIKIVAIQRRGYGSVAPIANPAARTGTEHNNNSFPH
jgi:hypothetical protein